MIVVDVLLAANLAVLAVLVVADRSRSHRARPVEVLAAARAIPREADKSRDRAPAGCGGVVIPFDRGARRAMAAATLRHPSATPAAGQHPAGGRLHHSR